MGRHPLDENGSNLREPVELSGCPHRRLTPHLGNDMPAASTWHDFFDTIPVTQPALAETQSLIETSTTTTHGYASLAAREPRVRGRIRSNVPVIYHLGVRVHARVRGRGPTDACGQSM